MDLWRLPPLLIIHLKRFQYTATSRRKLKNLVMFPLKGLDLKEFLAKNRTRRTETQEYMEQSGLLYWRKLGGKFQSELDSDRTSSKSNGLVQPLMSPGRSNSLYDLYAVVNHIGALGAGHYVANVFCESDGKWKCFNDHQCRDIDESEVISPYAYILFYARRDMMSLPIHQVFPPNSSEPISDDDLREILEQSENSRCVIS